MAEVAVIEPQEHQASSKIPYRRITEGESHEQFMGSIKPGEIFEHPDTLRLMVMPENRDPVRYPYD